MLEYNFTFESFGVRVTVESNRQTVVDRVRDIANYALLGRLTEIDPLLAEHRLQIIEIDNIYRAALGDEDFGDNPDLNSLLKYIGSRIRILVAEYTREFVFVHAGVVEWNGKAIVLPGQSFSGKTTLVAELVKLGATYFSDEYALFDEDGNVHPFPRPLAIRDSFDSAIREDVNVEALGGVPATRSARVGMMFFGKYRSKARWKPIFISPGVGIIELITHTIPMRVNSEFAIKALTNAVRGAKIAKSARGEADISAEKLLHFVDINNN
ncbi:MAG: hypothetical protein IPQ00_02085 [Chloracidobacterium sp.]|nr:hypothetical protein [Chloracidobacterium sp.]